MEPLTVTKDQVDRARGAGACSVRYKVGTPLEKISVEHLAWYAEKFPAEASEIAAQALATSGVSASGVPPLALFGYGYGYGYGYGDGSGSGYGYGYGDGYGYGYGSGYGYGDDYGYGYGSGDGSGSGSGSGSGDGRGAEPSAAR